MWVCVSLVVEEGPVGFALEVLSSPAEGDWSLDLLGLGPETRAPVQQRLLQHVDLSVRERLRDRVQE